MSKKFYEKLFGDKLGKMPEIEEDKHLSSKRSYVPMSKEKSMREVGSNVLDKTLSGEDLDNVAVEKFRSTADKAGDTLDYGKLRKEGMELGRANRGLKTVPGLKQVGKKVFSALPLIGGIAAAAASGDASAAVPLLGEADNLGPARDSLAGGLESGKLSEEDYERLKEKYYDDIARRNER